MAKAPLKRKSTKETTKMPVRKVEDIVAELESLKEKKKLIDTREKELKADLGIILEGEGIKTSTGSFNLVVGDKVAQKQARKSISLDTEKAEKLFKELGIWEEVIEVKEVINESYVEQAVHNEKLAIEDLESITNTKTTYAIVIKDYKPEEEMPLIVPNK